MIYQNNKLIGLTIDNTSNREVYSTEEQVIGMYLDQVLYERTFQIISPNNIGVETNVLQLDPEINVVKIDGMVYLSDKSVTPVNFSHHDVPICTWFKKNQSCILMLVSTAVETNVPVVLTLEYTKNNDESTIKLEDSQYLQSLADISTSYSMPVTSGGALYNEEVLTDV